MGEDYLPLPVWSIAAGGGDGDAVKELDADHIPGPSQTDMLLRKRGGGVMRTCAQTTCDGEVGDLEAEAWRPRRGGSGER